MIDRNSASASELLSGALQDTKVAVVVGETSYGKGSVQTLIPMAHDDGLKLTIAKYYTPNGRCIDGVGIEPDIEITSPAIPHPMYDLNLDEQNDPQVDAGKVLFNDDFWKTDF